MIPNLVAVIVAVIGLLVILGILSIILVCVYYYCKRRTKKRKFKFFSQLKFYHNCEQGS